LREHQGASDIPLTRELSTEEHILCVRGEQEIDSTELFKTAPTGFVSFKLAKIPKSVEDVTTIVLISQQLVPVANYTDSTTHYQWRFIVTVIDWKARYVIGCRTFKGTMPDTPSRKNSNWVAGDVYGDQPWGLVRTWLYGKDK
jgi:hypothetical protein